METRGCPRRLCILPYCGATQRGLLGACASDNAPVQWPLQAVAKQPSSSALNIAYVVCTHRASDLLLPHPLCFIIRSKSCNESTEKSRRAQRSDGNIQKLDSLIPHRARGVWATKGTIITRLTAPSSLPGQGSRTDQKSVPLVVVTSFNLHCIRSLTLGNTHTIDRQNAFRCTVLLGLGKTIGI